MLHKVRLPQITRERLTDVVVLQIWLLFYAASKVSLEAEDKQDCASKLNKCPRFSGRGEDIANWIWQGKTKKFGLLKKFTEDNTGTQAEKKTWLKRLSCEAIGLLKQAKGSIEPLGENRESWQATAATFFIGFYEDVLRQAPKPTKNVVGFPPCLFSDPHASQFGAQEFLRAFHDKNKSKLTICPACDEASYSIYAGTVYTNTGEVKIEADIDHYLPKESYPHLACHPYNLVPTCLPCNQRKKRNKDPLSKTPSQRHNVEDIFQIYREAGLTESIYLEINLSSIRGVATISSFKSKTGYDARECISVLREIYQIPDGWQGKYETIEENLFKDLKHCFDINNSPFDSPEIIDWLDYHLSNIREKFGHQAYTILMAGLLTTYIKEAISTFDQKDRQISKTPLLEELELECGIQEQATSTRLLSKPTVCSRIQRARKWRESQI